MCDIDLGRAQSINQLSRAIMGATTGAHHWLCTGAERSWFIAIGKDTVDNDVDDDRMKCLKIIMIYPIKYTFVSVVLCFIVEYLTHVLL